MTRWKRFRGLRQQTRQFPCPYCGKRFADVLRHLNHRESKCASWFTLPLHLTRSMSPHPPESIDSIVGAAPLPPTTSLEATEYRTSNYSHSEPFWTEFRTAGKIFGHGRSFVERFNDDSYATYRVQNPYYPFADQQEWELGSFLLGSGMSMQKLDEFLKLKLVFCSYSSV